MLKRRVLLVEDHPMFRAGIRRLVEETGRYQVVAEARDAHEAIHQADIHHPEVAMLDVQLPGVTGLQIGRILRKQQPRMRLVFISMHMDDDRLLEAVRIGASAFIRKDMDPEAMADTLRRVAAGENPINQMVLARPDLARRVLSDYRTSSDDADAPLAMPLSAREVQVLDCVAQGMANKQIADELFVTEKTVRNHMTSVLRKLESEDRFEAVLYAVRHGWIEIGPQWYAKVEPLSVA